MSDVDSVRTADGSPVRRAIQAQCDTSPGGHGSWQRRRRWLPPGVEEVLVVHPTERWVRCYGADGDGFAEQGRSRVLGTGVGELAEMVRWPES